MVELPLDRFHQTLVDTYLAGAACPGSASIGSTPPSISRLIANGVIRAKLTIWRSLPLRITSTDICCFGVAADIRALAFRTGAVGDGCCAEGRLGGKPSNSRESTPAVQIGCRSP